MTVVVDASLLIAALVDSGADGRWAEGILADGELASAEMVLAESANVLRRLESNRSIAASTASAAYGDLLQLELSLHGLSPLAARVWQLRATVNAYDAWYVALAETLDCPLATLDRRLARASGPRCDFVLR